MTTIAIDKTNIPNIHTLLATHGELKNMPSKCMTDLGWLIVHLAETLESVAFCHDETQYYLTGFEIEETKASRKR
jgi:hypothetical protein